MATSDSTQPPAGDLAAMLSTPTPRVLSPELRRVALQNSAPLSFGIFGALFGGFGLVFVWLFFPWNFQRDLALQSGDLAQGNGWIVAATETRLRINKTRVMRYAFEFRPTAGEKLKGECFTTGKPWQVGDPVSVLYLKDRPAIACPEGARISRSSLGLTFVILFPIAGTVLVGWVAWTRQRALALFRNGELTRAFVIDIEHTQTMANDYPIFKITLQREGALHSHPIIVRKWKPKVVSLLQVRMAEKQPICLLFDPADRSRFVLPETM
jgi:hypothetical protein